MIEREKLQHLIENIGIPKTLPDLTSWHQPDHRKHPIREDKEEHTKH